MVIKLYLALFCCFEPFSDEIVETELEEVEQFVIDATEAFWELGLDPRERRFFVGKLGSKYLIYLRTAQGSRGAPLSWAAAFGLICRCVQSLFHSGDFSRKQPFDTSQNLQQ